MQFKYISKVISSTQLSPFLPLPHSLLILTQNDCVLLRTYSTPHALVSRLYLKVQSLLAAQETLQWKQYIAVLNMRLHRWQFAGCVPTPHPRHRRWTQAKYGIGQTGRCMMGYVCHEDVCGSWKHTARALMELSGLISLQLDTMITENIHKEPRVKGHNGRPMVHSE